MPAVPQAGSGSTRARETLLPSPVAWIPVAELQPRHCSGDDPGADGPDPHSESRSARRELALCSHCGARFHGAAGRGLRGLRRTVCSTTCRSCPRWRVPIRDEVVAAGLADFSRPEGLHRARPKNLRRNAHRSRAARGDGRSRARSSRQFVNRVRRLGPVGRRPRGATRHSEAALEARTRRRLGVVDT